MMELYSDNLSSVLLHKMMLVALVGLIGLSDLVSTRHINGTDFRISRNSPHTECYTHVHRIRQITPYNCSDDDTKDKEKNEIIVENGAVLHVCKFRAVSTTSFENIMDWYKNGTKAVGVPKCYNSVNLCCLVAQMGNKINYCLEGKRLACYNGPDPRSKPECDPPLDEKPTRFNCKCYQSKFHFCDEENLPACNRAYDYKECLHKTAHSKYRCVCSQVNGDKMLHSKRCSELGDTETNAVQIDENKTNQQKHD